MKIIDNNTQQQISQDLEQNLVTENHESSIKEFNENLLKDNFTAAEMWRQHRNARSASDSIRKWDLN